MNTTHIRHKLILAATLVLVSPGLHAAETISGLIEKQFNEQTERANLKSFDGHEIQTMVQESLSEVSMQGKESIETVLNSVVDKLSSYQITGYAFDPNFDLNLALLFNHQNPEISVHFKNEEGKIKSREYQAYIKMFGLKLEASVRVNFVFFLNTDFNYFNMNKELSIKRGLEMQIYDAGISPFFSLTTFKGQPGTMVIMSFALGVPCHLLYPFFPVSYIYGGSLSPIES